MISPLSHTDHALDEAGSYAIAREIHARRVANGERPLGRKIGFTNRTIWAEYGVDAPIWGYVYDSTVQQSSGGIATLSLEALLQPRIEPEIVLHFARTPPVTHDEAAILGCIDWIAPAFEIIQCPYPNWKFTAADAIAAHTLHGALVVGTPVLVSEVDDCCTKLHTFGVELARNGELRAAGGGANVLDSPLLACAHLVEVLARDSNFEPVHAGEIVTTGTLTAPQAVTSGETWLCELDGIGLPSLSITFA